MFTSYDWEWFLHTTHKNGDDWEMVYDIVLTTLYSVITVILDPRLQLDAGFAAGLIVRIAWELNQLHLHGSTGQVNPSFLIMRQFAYNFVQGWNGLNCQWPFQEPKAEVSTICKAYVRAKFQGISPQNMAKNMVQYLDFRLLKIPLKLGLISLIFIFFPNDDSSTRLWDLMSSIAEFGFPPQAETPWRLCIGYHHWFSMLVDGGYDFRK